MKKNYLVVLIMMALLVTACSPAATPTAIPTVSLGSNDTASSTQSGDANTVSASAVVVPTTDARLAFTSIGRVTAVNVKVGDKVTAGQTLVTLDTTIQEARVREAEANLLAAQVDLKYKIRLGLDPVHRETAEAQVARTQALVDAAKAVLASQSTLTAPMNGTVVSVDIAPAEVVVPGAIVIVLGDLSSYKIETTDVSERDVTRVQIGQPVQVFIDALGEDLTGEVSDIARTSTTLGGDVIYKVTVELDQQPEGLLWGMSADVKIETAQ